VQATSSKKRKYAKTITIITKALNQINQGAFCQKQNSPATLTMFQQN